ncbi:glycine betaine ABC transporter substrate-binding protein [Allobranchiibius huperziae]|uniref:Osmoprotectant transport system substrate-binding protein n=1 Tax=Allobranchiibius huperziae TaxID=1874116 RepID=A0A853DHA4_9MICO|nr:glycine betaine ABC transporter substrate-binding protein [Allobranchiibius huperziae]NYJ74221.1 osmoprotectant transport system substrate-binding protein [Allobranchiibius huperziae]
MIRSSIGIVAVIGLGLGLAACGKDSSKTGGSNGATSGSSTVASKLIMGGSAEFKTRANGLPGLKKNYGVVFGKYTVTDTGGPVTVGALVNGQIDAADIFSTDPSIKKYGFVSLKDPKNNFAAQNITPLVTKSKATPGVEAVLNAVSAKLSQQALVDMVSQAITDKEDPAAVAKAFLAKNPINMPGKASGVSLSVGSSNFPESVVLGNLYSQALKSAGAKVTDKFNIGSREKYYPALKAGSINMFPEYNGALASYLDNSTSASSTAEVMAALEKALPSSIVALTPAQAQDNDSVMVTKATAEKYHLVSIADLAKKD